MEESSNSSKRRFRTRPQRERYLIVCEGEKTEPNYFIALSAILPRNLVDIKIEGLGSNTLSLVAAATSHRDIASCSDYPYDHVWVVFDKDSFPAYDFDNAINAAEARGMNAAWSNEAFEIWYILHFEERITGISRTEFKGKLTSHLGTRYKKNSLEMYTLLQKLGNEDDAVRRAKRLHKLHPGLPPSRSNPCTHVNKLVTELNEYKIPTE